MNCFCRNRRSKYNKEDETREIEYHCTQIRECKSSTVFCEVLGDAELYKNLNWTADPTKCRQVRNTMFKHIKLQSSGSSTPVDKRAEYLVCSMLGFYEENKPPDRDTSRRNLSEILQMALHVCAEFKVSNSSLVNKLAIEQLQLIGDISDWIDFLNPFANLEKLIQSNLYPYPSYRKGIQRQWITTDHLRTLEYYLKHCQRLELSFPIVSKSSSAKLLYDSAGKLLVDDICEPYYAVSLVDIPMKNILFGTMPALTLACLALNPPAIHLLLQYGAVSIIPNRLAICPLNDWTQPLFCVIHQLLTHQENIIDGPDGLNITSITSGFSPHFYRGWDAIECIRLLLRATPNPPIRFKASYTVMPHRHNLGLPCPSIFDLPQRFLSFLPDSAQQVPSSLQHLTKCKIRALLKDNYALPSHLNTLPLPNVIIQYLNLEWD